MRAVALVGAGPGDPELLTLRAEELLARAGVVVVDQGLEGLARRFAPQARAIAVPEGRAAPHAVLDAVGGGGGPVVRLYRGDPWLHPAFEAERAALEASGRPVEAVAGVAVEVAVPARAGIALHVRRQAVLCTLGPLEALPAACDPARTLVGSVDDAAAMAAALARAGHPDLPAALVAREAPFETWRGRLGDVHAAASALARPALLVVGAVCHQPGRPPAAPETAPPPQPPGPAAGARVEAR